MFLAAKEREEKKDNGTNGKYPYEAWYDGLPCMKSFCGVQGRFFQKEPLAAGGKNGDNK
jgi:hypothetical protein